MYDIIIKTHKHIRIMNRVLIAETKPESNMANTFFV